MKNFTKYFCCLFLAAFCCYQTTSAQCDIPAVPEFPTGACSGAVITLCIPVEDVSQGLNLDATVDFGDGAGPVPFIVAGVDVAGVGIGAGELCADIQAPVNETCAVINVSITEVNSLTCDDDTPFTLFGFADAATALAGALPINIPIYPAQPGVIVDNVADACSESGTIVTWDIVSADGTMICDTRLYPAPINNTCAIVVENTIDVYTSQEIEVLFGAEDSGCYEDLNLDENTNIYPAAFTTATTGTDAATCAPSVDLVAADGATICATQAVTCADGSFDFAADVAFAGTEPAGCVQTLTGTADACDAACAPVCTVSAGSTISGPVCSGETFTVTVNGCVTGDQEGLVLAYDFDPSTVPTQAEFYDGLLGGPTDPGDIGSFLEFDDCAGTAGTFTDVLGFTNDGCTVVTIDVYLVPSDADFTVDPTCAVEGPLTLTIYPAAFTTATTGTDAATCAPSVDLVAADGATVCATQAVTCADGSFDFAAAVPFAGTEPAGCVQTLTGTADACDAACAPVCTVSAGSTVSGPVCSGETYTVTVNGCVTGDQEGLVLAYDFDPSTVPTQAEFYDGLLGGPTDPGDIGSFLEFDDCAGTAGTFTDVSGFTNDGCTVVTIDVYLVPSDADFTVDPTCAVEGPLTLTIYPAAFTTATTGTDAATCAPSVDLVAADGATVCATQAVTCADGSFDFAADVAFAGTEPAGCIQTLTGTADACDAACTVCPNVGDACDDLDPCTGDGTVVDNGLGDGGCNCEPGAPIDDITGIDFQEMEGNCDDGVMIILPAGYTCEYEYLTGGTFAGTTGVTAADGVVPYPAALVDGDSGTVELTVTSPCGLTTVFTVNFGCFACAPDNGSWD